MKIRDGFILRTIADMNVVVTVGQAALERNSMFLLNERLCPYNGVNSKI